MKYTDLVNAIDSLLDTKLSIHVSGPPGSGKSSAVREVAARRGIDVIDVRAALLDPVDLRGLPVPNKKTGCVEWLPPVFLPRKGKCVLFLDEIAQAVPMVQNTLNQLLLDRKVGETELSPDCFVIGASNRQEDRAGAHRLNTAILSRLVHLELEADLDDWLKWSLENDIAPEIRAFLRFKPIMLWSFDPNAAAKTYPCPRTWAFCSTVYKSAPDRLHPAVLPGCVGPGAAAEFLAYTKLYKSLPDLDECLKHPKTAEIPTEASVRYALVGAVAERAKKLSAGEKLENLAVYSMRLPLEFATMALFDIQAVCGAFFATTAVSEWLKVNGKHLQQR